jgi:hypothetical protein
MSWLHFLSDAKKVFVRFQDINGGETPAHLRLLSSNTLDIRLFCRHNHMLDAERTSQVKPWRAILLGCLVLASCQTTDSHTSKTPVEAYKAQIVALVKPIWLRVATSHAATIQVGTVRVMFDLTSAGRAQNIRIYVKDTEKGLVAVVSEVIGQTRFPPIPPALLSTLPESRLPVDFKFTVYEEQHRGHPSI